ncbi:isocitrate/isopropylmalate family dehydrogenase [Leuconostoc mesenteroides]|uniref:isocitrate/isopropylmalate family dehydrogenase n=1 Tax=Leuconostoc TaxID=1243 RepID=UPI000D0C3C4C|nr:MULTISPECIES: isocitrate/isopropylmalate family dehydrogenase [Leuconostoc]MCJ2159887.1 isocitrate/isopropylmalate family dehydrogenase [Leuconostoc mesenteroides]MCM6836394.1 isocitrate/isopropylmalate family dehydrogenase [Leuconostoc mesenteroides]MCU4664008.1 isocitrate/isopropylmalate family dehydrogenase [Leuconostoc mesenteroides]MDV8927782.1 isocitrate/isopropylmalate family dehydrogenase [Leuconostoc mesenteroides]SPE14928.1 3-isopropylmalate dehydrogenase [Leuconostoc mesenteroide
MMYKLAILKGDKESSSVIDRALGIIKSSVNDSTAFEVTELPFGVNAVLSFNEPLPNQTLRELKNYDGILVGALNQEVGTDSLLSVQESLVALRKYLNITLACKAVQISDNNVDASPLKNQIVRDTDFIIVQSAKRANDHVDGNISVDDFAQDTITYEQREVEQVITAGFERAMNRKRAVTVVTPFDSFYTSKIWALTAEKIAKIYPDVVVNYVSLSCVISTIIQQPTSLDVVVAPKWVDQVLNEESQKITGLPETVPVSMKNNSGQMLYQLPQINVDDKNLMMAVGEDTAKLILKECFKHYDNLQKIGV